MVNKNPAEMGGPCAKARDGAGFLIIVQKGLENLNLWFRKRGATHNCLVPVIP